MKKTMNKPDIAKFHKLLAEDVSLKKISEGLGVTIDTLKKFTPDIMQAISDKKKKKDKDSASSVK